MDRLSPFPSARQPESSLSTRRRTNNPAFFAANDDIEGLQCCPWIVSPPIAYTWPEALKVMIAAINLLFLIDNTIAVRIHSRKGESAVAFQHKVSSRRWIKCDDQPTKWDIYCPFLTRYSWRPFLFWSFGILVIISQGDVYSEGIGGEKFPNQKTVIKMLIQSESLLIWVFIILCYWANNFPYFCSTMNFYNLFRSLVCVLSSQDLL